MIDNVSAPKILLTVTGEELHRERSSLSPQVHIRVCRASAGMAQGWHSFDFALKIER